MKPYINFFMNTPENSPAFMGGNKLRTTFWSTSSIRILDPKTLEGGDQRFRV